jgi:hypothetical protein
MLTRLRKILMSISLIEGMFSLVKHSEGNIKRKQGCMRLQRGLGTVLLSCEQRFRKVNWHAERGAGDGRDRGRASRLAACAGEEGCEKTAMGAVLSNFNGFIDNRKINTHNCET